MRRVIFATLIGLIAGPAIAGPEILPISGMGYLSYDAETGEITPQAGGQRFGYSLWAATQNFHYFWGADAGEMGLDWGDIAGPVGIGGFAFTEYTNSQAEDGDAWAFIMIYGEENGWDSTGRIALAGFLIENIPTSTHPPDEYWGYIWELDVEPPFIIDGSDMDGDGLVDFGYAQWFVWPTPGSLMGPGIAGDPNGDPPSCPGIENAFDLFIDPNLFTDPNLQNGFQGTYWMSIPFAQFYFELFAPDCPNGGGSGRYCSADIDGSFDCIVSLGDLAQLLSNYGCTTGCTRMMGDVDPHDPFGPGDGDIDLADLSELLSQYGDDCN